MASITKTPKGYRVQIDMKGVRKSKSFETKRDATLWAAQEEAAICLDVKTSPSAKNTLREALEKYRDQPSNTNAGLRWERIRINAFLEHKDWLPLDKKIGSVTPEDFEAFMRERAKTVKDGTILRELGLLSAILEEARYKWKWIKENPLRDAKKPTEPAHRERLISRAEIKRMLRGFGYKPGAQKIATLTESVGVCFLLALRTGMRAGDLTSLTWNNVHPHHAKIEIDKVGRKKKTGRDVPLSKKAVRVIEKMRGFDAKSVFFLTPQTLDARFRAVREDQKLTIRDGFGQIDKVKTFTFHDSRHTAATWIGMKGRITTMQMCAMFGWTDPKMALKYFNPSAANIAALLD
jgi:integrase